MNRLHTDPGGLRVTGENALKQANATTYPTGVEHASAQGATWWQQQGVSKRCGVNCTAQRCDLEADERNRYWPNCPHAVCPPWKQAALGVVGLSDHEQVTEALRPASELTPDEAELLVKHSYEAGLEARNELWRRNGVSP